MRVLRQGQKGDDVLAWEEFLRGLDCYTIEVDGFFDENSVDATKDFQRRYGLTDDGVVGRLTLGKAFDLGYDVLEDDHDNADMAGPNWPPLSDFGSRSAAERDKIFGHIAFRAAGSAANPEAIVITNNWAKDNIVSVTIPQLTKIPGIVYQGKRQGKGPRTGEIQCHKLMAEPMKALWQAWEDAGLLNKIITWAGLWVPRFIRGSRSTLSNHAYGTAWDINAPWNGLRRQPALVGKRGSVRELVPLANEHGFFWGGHWGYKNPETGRTGRSDGMHFEYAAPDR